MKKIAKLALTLVSAFVFSTPALSDAQVNDTDYLLALDSAIGAVDADIKAPKVGGDIILDKAGHDDLKAIKDVLTSAKKAYTDSKLKNKSVYSFFKDYYFRTTSGKNIFPLSACSRCIPPPPESADSYVALNKLYELTKSIKVEAGVWHALK